MGMSAVLLDTHMFLWWLFDDPRLPSSIRAFVRDVDHEVYVSAASVWEITTKFRLGKLPRAGSVARDVPLWIRRAGFEPLDIESAHAQLAGSWKIDHRDPFDRMLAAQANLQKLPLASVDQAMRRFPITVHPEP